MDTTETRDCHIHGYARRGRRPARLLSALLLLVPALLLATLTPSPASAASAAEPAPVPLPSLEATTTQVASGLRRPTALVAPDDGTDRLFITEKPGRVRVYHPDTGLAPAPLLDITASVDESGNERGLLGIAVPPDFADSRALYLAYTALPDGAVTLARYRLDESRLEPLLSQPHAEYSNHNGGQLAFGPDGNLYWSIGDGGGSGDPFRSGQRLDTLLGKIMRIDVSRACAPLAYCVPGDNPFVDTPGARAEIWLYGLRNPWRFSFDRADGSMWIGDVGQGRWEEIDHLPAGQGGLNLGWSCYEGLERFEGGDCASGGQYTEPVFTYSPYTGGCSVIGGHVYRGREYADLVGGVYIATDYCSSTVWALRPDGRGGYEQAEIGEMPTQVTSVGTTRRRGVLRGQRPAGRPAPGVVHAGGAGLPGGPGGDRLGHRLDGRPHGHQHGRHPGERVDARVPAAPRTDRRVRLEHGADPGKQHDLGGQRPAQRDDRAGRERHAGLSHRAHR